MIILKKRLICKELLKVTSLWVNFLECNKTKCRRKALAEGDGWQVSVTLDLGRCNLNHDFIASKNRQSPGRVIPRNLRRPDHFQRPLTDPSHCFIRLALNPSEIIEPRVGMNREVFTWNFFQTNGVVFWFWDVVHRVLAWHHKTNSPLGGGLHGHRCRIGF